MVSVSAKLNIVAKAYCFELQKDIHVEAKMLMLSKQVNKYLGTDSHRITTARGLDLSEELSAENHAK